MNVAAPVRHHHEESNGKKALKWIAGGTALAAGAVILSPYILPLVGIGTSELAVETMSVLHHTSSALGSGLAGAINSGLDNIPLIGETIAKGGLAPAIASGVVGIGGVLLGRYVGKHEDGKHFIKWGKVITTAAVLTSALIALPSVLTGISAGIAFLAGLESNALAAEAVTALTDSIGAVNTMNLKATGASFASVALPHLLACGAAAAPAVLSFRMQQKGAEHTEHHLAPAHNDATQTQTSPMVAHEHTYAPNVGKDAVLASVKLEKPTTAGEEVRGVLVLKHAEDGKPLSVDELKFVNEAHIHFFINNSSLTDYHHIHPLPTEKPGEYAFNFKAATSQPYTGFAAIVTKAGDKHRSLRMSFPPAVNRYVSPNVRMNSQVDVDGLSFDWKMDGPMQKGKLSNIEVTVKDASGKPVTDLQPVYGEWCHLEGFTANHGTMLHTHPTGREPSGKDDRMGSPLRFTITPDQDGPTQFYVQVKRGDKDIYAPIGQYVKTPEKATDRVMSGWFSGNQGRGVSDSFSRA